MHLLVCNTQWIFRTHGATIKITVNAALLLPNHEWFEAACELCTVTLAAESHSEGYKVKTKQQKVRLMAGTCVAWAATWTEIRVNTSEVEKQNKTTSMGGLAIINLSDCLPSHIIVHWFLVSVW